MTNWTLYYNPKCGTCRKVLEILNQHKIQPQTIEYLKTAPSLKDLQDLAEKLGEKWPTMIRMKEPIFDELNLAQHLHNKKVILAAIAQHPVLLQRPIVVKNNRALVARPPEEVMEFLSAQ